MRTATIFYEGSSFSVAASAYFFIANLRGFFYTIEIYAYKMPPHTGFL